MEMYYLVILLYGRQAISSVVIPEKYTKEQCEKVKASVRDDAICVPTPVSISVGEYCKWHYENVVIDAWGTIKRVCD